MINRIRIIWILWLGFLAHSFAFAQENPKVTQLLDQADSCIAGNKLTVALSKTEAALRISSGNIPALEKRIVILYRMNDDKEAYQYTEQGLAKYPQNPGFYYLRGVINNSRSKYNKAIDDFNHGIDLKPSSDQYKFYLGRGIAYLNLMEYDMALSDLTKTLEMNDTIASAYHSRAMVNYQLRDYTAAVNDFQKVLKYSKGNAALYFNLGMSYYRLNDMEHACPYFHKACTMGNIDACRMALMECAKSIPSLP